MTRRISFFFFFLFTFSYRSNIHFYSLLPWLEMVTVIYKYLHSPLSRDSNPLLATYLHIRVSWNANFFPFLTTQSRFTKLSDCRAQAYTRVTVLIVNWLSISDTLRHTGESISGIMHMRSGRCVHDSRIEIRYIEVRRRSFHFNLICIGPMDGRARVYRGSRNRQSKRITRS